MSAIVIFASLLRSPLQTRIACGELFRSRVYRLNFIMSYDPPKFSTTTHFSKNKLVVIQTIFSGQINRSWTRENFAGESQRFGFQTKSVWLIFGFFILYFALIRINFKRKVSSLSGIASHRLHHHSAGIHYLHMAQFTKSDKISPL